MKRCIVVGLVVMAACKAKPKDQAADRPAQDAAPTKPTVTAPVAADAAAGAATAPTPDAAPVAVTPTTPPTTCTVGEPVVVATAARTPGDLDLAIAGDRTALAWFDGGKAFVAVMDPAGVPVAEPVNLGDTKETFVLATPPGFAVVTITHDHCDMTVRTLDAAGVLGAPVALASKVCNPQHYPVAAARDGQLLVVTSSEYEAQGLTAIRWRDGAEPAVTTLVEHEVYAAPAAIAATDTGFAVAWHENEEDPMDLSNTKVVTIDDAGVASKPTKFKEHDGEVALVGAKPIELIQKGDALPALRAFAGRTWKVASSFGTGPTKVVPVDADGKAAGAGFDAPGNALAHDGARGAVASWDKKSLRVHALTCP